MWMMESSRGFWGAKLLAELVLADLVERLPFAGVVGGYKLPERDAALDLCSPNIQNPFSCNEIKGDAMCVRLEFRRRVRIVIIVFCTC